MGLRRNERGCGSRRRGRRYVEWAGCAAALVRVTVWASSYSGVLRVGMYIRCIAVSGSDFALNEE